MTPEDIISMAIDVINAEADAVREQALRVGNEFVSAVEILKEARGKVVLTGMGKSGIVCKKIASTLASTGTPAFFLHPSEAIHGDVGIITRNDVVIALSNSGETVEILSLLPVMRRMGVKIIAMVGNVSSTMSRYADVVLNVGVEREACPLGMAPTASTTAALAVGDALAVVLLKEKGFSLEDFAVLHPGGTLGKKLKSVGDLMHRGDEVPLTSPETDLTDVLFEISSKRLGVAGVVDEGGNLIGVITDGDLRRAMAEGIDVYSTKAEDVMSTNPKEIRENDLAAGALSLMERNRITSLFVFDENKENLVGVIHIHDLLRGNVT
jgi:arabinose-5-phosphate isomerase